MNQEERIPLCVLAAVDDLFFAARIRETARQTGVCVEVLPASAFEAALSKHLTADSIESVIVDLSSADSVDLIRRIKCDACTARIFVLGFASHVAAEQIAAARKAGADQVMARSAFTREMPRLLRRFVGTEEPGPTRSSSESSTEPISRREMP